MLPTTTSLWLSLSLWASSSWWSSSFTLLANAECNFCAGSTVYTTDPTTAFTIPNAPIWEQIFGSGSAGGSMNCAELGDTSNQITSEALCTQFQAFLHYISFFQNACCVTQSTSATTTGCTGPFSMFGLCGNCFSGESTVQIYDINVDTIQTVAMKDVQIGDSVLTADGTYSKVYSFGHYQPDVDTKYLQIATRSMKQTNQPLEISQEHLLYKMNVETELAELIPASNIKVGDVLVVSSHKQKQEQDVVHSINPVARTGAYSPLTTKGDLLVNGVVASNYVTRTWIQRYLSSSMLHYLQHGASLPYRIYCSYHTNSVCKDETYDPQTGFSSYVTIWFTLEQRILSQDSKIIKMLCLAVLFLPILLTIFLGKLISTSSSALVTQFVLVTVTIWYYRRNNPNNIK